MYRISSKATAEYEEVWTGVIIWRRNPKTKAKNILKNGMDLFKGA